MPARRGELPMSAPRGELPMSERRGEPPMPSQRGELPRLPNVGMKSDGNMWDSRPDREATMIADPN